MDRKGHWGHLYRTKADTDVSWFQAEPALSLRLLEAAGLNRDS